MKGSTRSFVRIDSIPSRTYHLFAIGVDRYLHHPRLSNAVNDADSVCSCLIEHYGIDRDLTLSLYNEEATRDNILGQLRTYIETLTSNDNLIIYFAGHGYDDQKLKRGGWIPYEAERSFTQYISSTEIMDHLEQIQAKHSFLIMDSCFAGKFLSSNRFVMEAEQNLELNILKKRDSISSKWILCSGGIETVADGAPNTQSPFAKSLLGVLKDNPKKHLSAEELIYLVKVEMLDSQFLQEPQGNRILTEGFGHFYFKKTSSGLPAQKTSPLSPAQTQKPIIEQVLVEGGSFYMGSDDSEALEHEKPIRNVQVDDFYMDIHPVTIAQFRKFIQDSGWETDAEKEKGSSIEGQWHAGANWACDTQGNVRHGRSTDQQPVIFVSWNDAIAYCNWLSEKEKLDLVYQIGEKKVRINFQASGYRLPTEAEWEYAAGEGQIENDYIYSGSHVIQKVAWVNQEKTESVSTKSPNDLGLFDLSGLVWEWCSDYYGIKYYSWNETHNPTGPKDGTTRSLRGGSWANGPEKARITYRYHKAQDFRSNSIGFRCVRNKN